MTILLYLMACLMSPSPLINLAESRETPKLSKKQLCDRTLDTAIDMLDPQPAVVECLVGPLLLPRELLAAWLLGRHEDLHLGERKGQEAEIL